MRQRRPSAKPTYRQEPAASPRDEPAWVVSAIVGCVLFGATLLLCDFPKRIGAIERWPLAVDRILAWPVELTGPSDLRAYVLPIGLASLLLWVASGRHRNAAMPARSRRDGWFEGFAAAVIAWACASAWMNGTWASSRGWVFGLACGLGWATALGWIFTGRCLRRTMLLAAVVSVLGAGLSLLHRQVLGEAYYELPVGPVTLTAALGALWVAMTVVGLAGAILQRYPWSFAGAATGVIAGLFSALLLVVSGRRGAALGCVVGIGVAAAMASWRKFTSKGARAVISTAALAVLVGVGGYIWNQGRNPNVSVSSSLRVRAIYWEKMAEMISKSPLFGQGPDQFIFKATTAMSRQRAEEPTKLIGTVDYDAHNEWFQAACELGIPGGLIYLALPIGTIIAGWRRWQKGERAGSPMLLALMAGIAVLLVSEAASVNLRHPILAAWYWTILGLVVAMARGDRSVGEAQGLKSLGFGMRAASLSTAFIIVIVVGIDLRAAMHHAKGRALLNRDDAKAAEELALATGRFSAAKWLEMRTDLGTAQANVFREYRKAPASRTSGSLGVDAEMAQQLGRQAISTWQEVVRASPGYIDSGFRLAEVQTHAGDTEGAIRTLQSFLKDVNPYHTQANVLLANIGRRSPMENLEAVCRGLRSSAMNRWLVRPATRSFGAAETAGPWAARVDQARQDIAKSSEIEWTHPLAPEIMRVEALRLATSGRLAEAASVQRLAAEAYRRLNAAQSPVARPAAAVADAWYLAGRFLFDSDPTRFAEAYQVMLEAERLMMLSVVIANVARMPTSLGEAVMTLRTEEMGQLMRFSAKMHLAAQGDLSQVQQRIGWSLGGAASSQELVNKELGEIASELVKAFGEMPPERRPAGFARIVDLSRRFAPR